MIDYRTTKEQAQQLLKQATTMMANGARIDEWLIPVEGVKRDVIVGFRTLEEQKKRVTLGQLLVR